MKNPITLILMYAFVLTGCHTHGSGDINMPAPHLSNNHEWRVLSVREKAAQLVCYQYNKEEMLRLGNGSMEQFFQKYPVGAVFLANWTIAGSVDKDSVKNEYINVVQQCNKASKYPLLFSEDFETGLGFAIPGYTQLVTEMGLGAANSTELADQYGNIIASEARSVGINWLLHPVADLNINPFSYITNVRSVGTSADLAIKLLPHQIKAMQANGVAATAKHFPGDGTDFINQHFSTSKNKLSIEEWNNSYGKVYQTLIDGGVKVIMPGHISFPAYQKHKHNGEYLPATLSNELIEGLLKKELNFKGVVVSDALNMAGIAGFYDSQLETEVECFKAGTDMLLWPSLEVIDTIEARVVRGEIDIRRLNDAVARVWNLKDELGLFDPLYKSVQPLLNNDFQQHQQQADNIARKAITPIGENKVTLPWITAKDKNILLVEVMQDYKEGVFNVLVDELTKRGAQVTLRRNLSYFEQGSQLQVLAEQYDKILFAYYSVPGVPWGDLSLYGPEALTMWSSNRLPKDKVISIGFGDPYKNIIYLPRITQRINCYNIDKHSQKALVEALWGDYKTTGVSPVTYPQFNYAIEEVVSLSDE
nr:glycoside hydrolase family 3 N-terminal domain-containing protein [uncultured Carboxylicivirga sp.]